MCYYSVPLSTSFFLRKISYPKRNISCMMNFHFAFFHIFFLHRKRFPTSSHLTRHTTQTFFRLWADSNLIWFILFSFVISNNIFFGLPFFSLSYARSFKWEINFLCHINNTTLSTKFCSFSTFFPFRKYYIFTGEHKWLRPHLVKLFVEILFLGYCACGLFMEFRHETFIILAAWLS